MKTKDQKMLGFAYLIGLIRQRGCQFKKCGSKTRLFLGMPLADIDGGKPGLGGIAVCGDCLPAALKELDRASSA